MIGETETTPTWNENNKKEDREDPKDLDDFGFLPTSIQLRRLIVPVLQSLWAMLEKVNLPWLSGGKFI
jgi:hypothetical protein